MNISNFRKVFWGLAGIAALFSAGVLLWSELSADRAQTEIEPPFFAAFELTDHKGTIRTEKDFTGRFMLVFFGFTNCPDVCPTTLAEVSIVMELLGDESENVQPIFITVDPERDTQTALAEYVPLFDTRIIGLTGTPEQIAQTTDIFPIYHEKIEETSTLDAYTVSHTSHLLLFDRDAGFVESWTYGTPANKIFADIIQRI